MKSDQNGFVLVATLWILAAITLGAGFFALWTQSALDLSYQSDEDLQGEIDMNGTRAVLLYLMATQPKTVAGLTTPKPGAVEQPKLSNPLEISVHPVGGEIALDDRAYKGFGKACFSIQDEGGLMGLNHFSREQMERLLGLSGVPGGRRGALIDKLLDYTDNDNFSRLNGAEAKDYEAMGLEPPPNRGLLTSWEMRNVIGWNDFPELWVNHLLPRLTTVVSSGNPNPNTAPKPLLKTIPGIDDEIADRLIAARRKTPFFGITDMNRAAGRSLKISELGTPFFPSSHLRITLWHIRGHHKREIHLEVTPLGKAPWLIDYELSVPFQKRNDETLQEVSSPVFTAPDLAIRQ